MHNYKTKSCNTFVIDSNCGLYYQNLETENEPSWAATDGPILLITEESQELVLIAAQKKKQNGMMEPLGWWCQHVIFFKKITTTTHCFIVSVYKAS